MCFSGSNEGCGKCFSARVCENSTGTYLNILRLFNRSLTISPCELYSNTYDIVNFNVTEEMCINISSNLNYSILCPICNQDIYYEIPNSIFANTEDCLGSGKYYPTYILIKNILAAWS